jgi:glycosyltransferase involved in cell wall biosynthesis
MRILHCPTDIAGQLGAYAESIRRAGHTGEALAFAPNQFGFQTDTVLELTEIRSVWRRRAKLVTNFLRVIGKYDIYHFHFGGTLLPHHVDLPLLRMLRKKMVMNWWGSDVRRLSIAFRENPFIAQAIKSDPNHEARVLKRIERIGRAISVAVVADAELRSYVEPFFERVVLVPQAIHVEDLIPAFPDPEERLPLVVHCPSSRALKGTPHVLEAARRLEQRCRFRFELLEGLPHDELIVRMASADIVIDQVLLGVHGILSVEAMALGKPVLCYIREDLKDEYPADLPIVSANPNTLEAHLERLLSDGEERTRLGRRGREYAEKRHSLGAVGRKLVSLYESL